MAFQCQSIKRQERLCFRLAARRHLSQDDKPLPKSDKPAPGPNQQQLPHVSEEAATMSKITGEEGPGLEEGTPVQEVEVAIHAGVIES